MQHGCIFHVIPAFFLLTSIKIFTVFSAVPEGSWQMREDGTISARHVVDDQLLKPIRSHSGVPK